MNIRQDAWSDNDDRFLANTILKHIREGSTQLQAFDEVGDALERTSAACGFRWNAIVRLDYEQEVKQAKRTRKQRMKETANHAVSKINHSKHKSYANIDSIISGLQHLQTDFEKNAPLTSSQQMEEEVLQLESKNKEMQEEITRVKQEYDAVKQDYDMIVSMMNRARELAMTEETNPSPNFFRMDRNGNLEKIENA
ncbi:RsfA family transcriptional regulator [Salibacterium salarium]|uniref:RsfA family transcriptional regulator n=1 Tax=Salibacterium salarium TaxID=284579 RepID=A0A3R9P5G7_9BACI|nr:RsfA family transcriptional regulator [Salibacterium salarium]RSL31596.1 RsfA family transcriptional regulator [Salibacterium salarium]